MDTLQPQTQGGDPNKVGDHPANISEPGEGVPASNAAAGAETSRAVKRGGHTRGTREPGYGGEAKGAGNGKARHSFGGKGGPGRGHYSKDGEARLERQARHSEEMREVLYEIAHNGEQESTRVSAAEKLLNRLEGLPVQRVLSAEMDPISMMSDEQLDSAIAKQRELVDGYQRTKAIPAGPAIDHEPVPTE